ncbi:MAG: FHA domain-containing protein [Desulfobacteraceae bacterium]|nr:FHA domain-containing protein [Desulfobacteraceae bacterium]
MAYLILIYKNKVIKKIKITENVEIGIGRNDTNKIFIDDISVSGKHAKVQKNKNDLMLTDLGSTNGTLVNNEKVSRCKLMHQDFISVGNYQLLVDMYETLSLEAAIGVLKSTSQGQERESEQTVMLNHAETANNAPARLVFLSSGKEYELLTQIVTIGKNKSNDIPIRGLWSFLAGETAAKIERREGKYLLSYSGGRFKPKVNGVAVTEPVSLHHNDMIKIGPLKMQLEINY